MLLAFSSYVLIAYEQLKALRRHLSPPRWQPPFPPSRRSLPISPKSNPSTYPPETPSQHHRDALYPERPPSALHRLRPSNHPLLLIPRPHLLERLSPRLVDAHQPHRRLRRYTEPTRRLLLLLLHADISVSVAVTAFTITSMFYLIVHTHRDRVLDTPSIHRRALCRRFKFMCPALCGLAFIWAAIFAAMTLAPKGKDFRHLFDKPPHTAWGVAAVLAIVEVYVPRSCLFFTARLLTCFPRRQWREGLEGEGSEVR